jgi:hypothetical protein
MDFFQKHDKALRKGRLLQAATAIYNSIEHRFGIPKDAMEVAVSRALQLEKQIEKELEIRG